MDPSTALLVAVGGAVIGGFFTVLVWPLVKTMSSWLWEKATNTLSGRGFERRYLDWIIKQHRYLPSLPTTLASVAERRKFELDRLYVSLAVTKDARKSEEMSVGEALRNYSHLVVLGDPGAGKTTMLRFLALTFAKARRKAPSASSDSERKREVASYNDARRRVREEFGFEGYPLPIFVYLNRLRDVTKWSSDRSVLDALRDEWKSIDTLRDFPSSFFDDKLERGECIFLFDAFDELGTQGARDTIARHIGALASSAPSGNRFVVTSRIVGYNDELREYGFDVLTVQHLTWELISQLIRQWYAALEDDELGDQLLTTLQTNTRIYELAVNPMLLSLIALVQYIRRWTCVGSVDCLRLRTVRGKENIATNEPDLPTGISPRSYPAP
jgi:predicted NACHT family NTPase